MSTTSDIGAKTAGREALQRLRSTEPALFLAPSQELSKAARSASEYLFSLLSPHAPKSPFTHLLTEGFDTEQIWQQIDLQAQPLLNSLRRHIRKYEKNIGEIEKQFNWGKDEKLEKFLENEDNKGSWVTDSERKDLNDVDGDDVDEDEEEEDDDDDDEKEEESEKDEDGKSKKLNGIDDQFFKMTELEKFIEEDEASKYGINEHKNKRKSDKTVDKEVTSEDDEDEDEELGLMVLEDDDERWENDRYEDFFVPTKNNRKRIPEKHFGGLDEMDMGEPDGDGDNKDKDSLSSHEKELAKHRSQVDEMDKANLGRNMQGESLSTHEKELARVRTQIKEMERANLEPKTWTMQGEVTAAKRPKNSALEVDLDFEHNVRPAPVISEELDKSIEDLIRRRILEGRFDNVQRRPALMHKEPREKMALDENKSKKGLSELYEDDYAQKTGLISAALSSSDALKKETSMLFKKLCVKLDALSHFHFTPKPVIEDMCIRANVPALAMEEVAPIAVSDAAMLAPEQVFSGKGYIKGETELTKQERKRRRANKKRKFKAESSKKMAMQAQKENCNEM